MASIYQSVPISNAYQLMRYESIFKGLDERTGVLVGLWFSSLLKSTGIGSRGASNE